MRGEALARLVAVCIALLALGIALGTLVVAAYDDWSAPPIVIEDPRPDTEIAVSVEGAVAAPGVYRLKGDARVQDALNAAGGPAPNADLTRVNLAARLHDEERLIIPALAASGGAGGSGTATPPAGVDRGQPAPININTAGVDLLDTLPGIGPVLAERIVAYREANGPFRSVDELAQVDGISLDMVDALRSLITV
jgi:competence protein ComEA